MNFKNSSFIDSSRKDEIVAYLKKEKPDYVNAVICEADRNLKHEFNLLGSGWMNLAEYAKKNNLPSLLPWNDDFKSNYHYDESIIGIKKLPGDKPYVEWKVPTELNRCMHMLPLGQAYWFTGEKKYGQEIISQIDDFINNCPYLHGVAWTCAMDVGMRAANWVAGVAFVKNSEIYKEDFARKFKASLKEHARYIMDNLEDWVIEPPHPLCETPFGMKKMAEPGAWKIATNHYMGNITGLMYIVSFLPMDDDVEKWLDYAVKSFEKEIELETLKDGMNCEASTSYHRLVTEYFFYVAVLGERCGIKWSENYKKHLYNMFSFIVKTTRPGGEIVQIGDHDSGKHHVFLNRIMNNHNYLADIGAAYFNDAELKTDSGDTPGEIALVLGVDCARSFEAMPAGNKKNGVFHLEDSRIVVARYDGDYININAIRNGQGGAGGHAHNDKLSFELMLAKVPVIVDPGTGIYTNDLSNTRNMMKSTRFHNTVEIDGMEQNEFVPAQNFYLYDISLGEIHSCIENEREIQVKASHEGYKRLTNGIEHNRSWKIDKKAGGGFDKISVIDEFKGDKAVHEYLWSFNLHPEIRAIMRGKRVILIANENHICELTSGNDLIFRQEPSYYSYEYGMVHGSIAIRCGYKGMDKHFEFKITKLI
ncbi:MAG: alginate lyase family protein [bacterium]